ncbi:MAG: hypothetical protein L6405_05580, partial [Actinomycetia bacterium]|nr:hypothetical protein [Actinomycetes bacterium]
IVFLQLKRKGNEFYFYNEPADGEVDFVIREGLKIKELIQVCHNLDDFLVNINPLFAKHLSMIYLAVLLL